TTAASTAKPNSVGVVMISAELKTSTEYKPATATCPDFIDTAAPANSTTTCKWHGGDSVCEVTCNHGYYMDGARVSTCSRVTGEWSDTARTCRPLPQIEDRSFQVGLVTE
ncbi:hypothetical protein SARC_17906, partial [Sphaeroforma arctica JP610]